MGHDIEHIGAWDGSLRGEVGKIGTQCLAGDEVQATSRRQITRPHLALLLTCINTLPPRGTDYEMRCHLVESTLMALLGIVALALSVLRSR